MYWKSEDYDKMAKLVIDIYLEYEITQFPIDEKDICKKIGIELLPYSNYSQNEQKIFMRKSADAFYIPLSLNTSPKIYVNDMQKSRGRIRYSVFHEIKHYLNNDTEETLFNENMADYFARYFMCPIPYLVKIGIDNESAIASNYIMSKSAANNTLKNIHNRKAKYGNKIFDYEEPLINLLCLDKRGN